MCLSVFVSFSYPTRIIFVQKLSHSLQHMRKDWMAEISPNDLWPKCLFISKLARGAYSCQGTNIPNKHLLNK